MTRKAMLIAAALLLLTTSAFANSFLMVNFLIEEGGAPFTFDKVIISDGEWIQVFENITEIETEVPDTFTFTTVYHVGTHYNQFEFPIELEPTDTLELEVYAVDPNSVTPRERPYLIGKEPGATVDLQWEYSDVDTTLSYTVQKEPPQTYAFITTWIRAAVDMSTNQNYQNPSPDVCIAVEFKLFGRKIEIWYCTNGEDGGSVDGDTIARTTHSISSHPPDTNYTIDSASIVFTDVMQDLTPLGIRRANHNYARILDEYHPILHTLDGQSFEPEYFYPQYAVVPDSNYIFELNDVSNGFVSLKYPLFVSDSADYIVFDLYLPKKTELHADSFFIAGEDFYANSTSSIVINAPGDSIALTVETELPYDYWGCFVVDDMFTVGSMYALPGPIYLEETYDYIVNHTDGYNLIVTRISPEYTSLVFHYAPADIEEDVEISEHIELYATQLGGKTEIRFVLPQNSPINLSIYSQDGRKVTTLLDEYKNAGTHTVTWDGTDDMGLRVPVGVYFCRLETSGVVAAEKVIRLQ